MALPKLRVSTIVFLVLVAAGLLLANIPGRLVYAPGIRSCSDGKYGPHFECGEDSCRHGWPSSFLLREPTELPTSPFWRLSVWRLSEGIAGWSWWGLAADVLTGVALLVVVGGAFEFSRRRRGRFQICPDRRVCHLHVSGVRLCVLGDAGKSGNFRHKPSNN